MTETCIDPKTAQRILDRYPEGDATCLIHALQDIQAEFGYVPYAGVALLCTRLNIPISKAFSVATFYRAFSLEPKGKIVIRVCTGTACHLRGAEKIKDVLREKMNIDEGQTTEDRLFTLEAVRCIGCCASGPVITVNKDTYGGLDRSSVLEVINDYEQHGSA